MTRAERVEQNAVLERLRRDGRFLAERFGLPLRAIDAEGPRVKSRYGICYDDGSIRIRLRHAKTRKLLKYSALVGARARPELQPDPLPTRREPPKPVQLELF